VVNPRGLKRRVRQRLFGVVVCAAGEHKYKDRFENELEKVCSSTSLRVESHVLVVFLIESLPLLPAAQQEEAQGGAEDADDEEEEEENDFGGMLAGIEDGALPTDCNIEADEYEDLFGHQHQFLENLSGRTISSSNKLRFDTLAAEAATAADKSAAVAAIGTIATGAATGVATGVDTAAKTAVDTAAATTATDAGPVENPVEIFDSTQEGIRTQRMEQAMSRSSVIGNKKSKKFRARLWR
jgi:hypothetical protein